MNQKTEITLSDQIEAVLFDLDGTLMDTDNQSAARFSGLLTRLRFRNPEKLARKLVMAAATPVNDLITFIDRIGLDKLLMNVWQRISHGNKLVPYGFHPIPGVKEMLGELKDHYRLAVVSTRSQAEAEAFLKENGLEDYFELVIHRTSTRRLKPHPEPILLAAQQLQIPVEHCLMVGDTIPDIRSAKAAGASSVGVLCGYGTREELEKAGATLVVEHTKQVREALLKL